MADNNYTTSSSENYIVERGQTVELESLQLKEAPDDWDEETGDPDLLPDMDITGYRFLQQIKKDRNSPKNFLSLTTENGGLTISGTTTLVRSSFIADFPAGTYYIGMLAIDTDGKHIPIEEGTLIVKNTTPRP